jgi:hypothetical protein
LNSAFWKKKIIIFLKKIKEKEKEKLRTSTGLVPAARGL